jgi:hypothetical protein
MSMTAETNPLSDLPEQVRRVLIEFIDAAETAFTTDLRSIILFGSAAVYPSRKSSGTIEPCSGSCGDL